MKAALDLLYINRDEVWLDIGKEVIAVDSTPAGEVIDSDPDPTTCLFKSCCLEAFSQWAILEEPAKSVIPTVYPTAMLRDASDITLDMSRSSRKRQEGWVFSQAYNSYKEIFDAAKTKPFSNLYLRQLTWDPLVAEMIKQQGRAGLTPDSRLRVSYQASKRRLFTSLKKGLKTLYGVREKHRISLAFFERMRSCLETTGD